MFVLWAAHWFQRDYRGGQRKWEDLRDALALPLEGNEARRLTKFGLQIWGRPAVRNEAAHQWLRTLAVEGGFPAGALAEAEGWVGRYLARVVGALLTEETLTPEAAFAAAEAQGREAAGAYRQEIFYAVAADLAMAVVRLRHSVEADERARGMPVSAWLDATSPGWRDDLPITAGSRAAAQLVDGLMRAEALTVARGGLVGCERQLRRHSGFWRQAVKLGLDGHVSRDFAARFGGQTKRLRAYPAGLFARYTAGELALFEPPGDDEAGWRIRPSRTNSVVIGVPFTTPIETEIRQDGSPVVQTRWPGGEAVRSDLRVFEITAHAGSDECTLTLIGTGTGAYRPDAVALSVPKGWSVTGHADDASVARWDGETDDGRLLWRLVGRGIVRAPDGDVYCITTGQSGTRRDQLSLSGARPVGIESEEVDVELFAGAPTVHVREGTKARAPTSNEIRWRPAGERAWRPLRGGLSEGRIELAWREPETGFMRDRRRLFILAAGATLKHRREGDAVVYRPEDFNLATLTADDEDLTLERRDEIFVARFHQRPARRARLKIGIGESRPLAVSAPFPLGSGIAQWSGTQIRGGRSTNAPRLTLDELRECVAFGEGEQVLHARLLNRQGQSLPGGAVRWAFRDELPLHGVADDLAALLLPFADIDVSADLSFQYGVDHWRVRQFEIDQVSRSGLLVPIEGVWTDENLSLYGRPVTDPSTERLLGQSTPLDRFNRRPPKIPEDLTGTWLLYLRRGESVVARPSVASFGPSETASAAGLAAAAATPDFRAREGIILARMADIAAGYPDTAADVQWLATLCASLRGLPPASLDPLRLLATRPGAAARVALRAAETEREAVFALADGLSFTWCMVPWHAWARAADLERAAIQTKLEEALPQGAADLARSIVEDAAIKIAKVEPLLRWPLLAAGLLAPQHLDTRPRLLDAAQDHIRRYGDRVNEQGTRESLFRTELGSSLLPDFTRFDTTHLESLDAPCAAAAVAAGKAELASPAIRRIKSALRADPIYFNEAFDAHFVELHRNEHK
ncbi:hypothetical protein F6X53_20095 [Methylobacterium soli]|uniref:Uncharacterized protein n=1 Tax=Methylobacterium soli TaxID=553447 RepID=A0A6L3SU92_9HYPH|nr:hypothetical protein F6X53_20095 [Methylobacterium soli]